MVIHVYHPYRQPEAQNHCLPLNGRCSHVCLPAPQLTANSAKTSCACPRGLRLDNDNLNCIHDRKLFFFFLLFVSFPFSFNFFFRFFFVQLHTGVWQLWPLPHLSLVTTIQCMPKILMRTTLSLILSSATLPFIQTTLKPKRTIQQQQVLKAPSQN